MEAKIWNKNVWVNDTDPTKLKHTFSELLKVSGLKYLIFKSIILSLLDGLVCGCLEKAILQYIHFLKKIKAI